MKLFEYVVFGQGMSEIHVGGCFTSGSMYSSRFLYSFTCHGFVITFI